VLLSIKMSESRIEFLPLGVGGDEGHIQSYWAIWLELEWGLYAPHHQFTG
jgi:hypothetical protein